MLNMNEVILRILLFASAFAGMLVSLYFVLVYHQIFPPDASFVPRVCRMDRGSCDSVLSTAEARMLGIPNFHLGLGYYMLLIVVSLEWTPWSEFREALIFASTVTVVMSVYLSYSLLRKIRSRCNLCFIAHGVNITIFILLLELR